MSVISVVMLMSFAEVRVPVTVAHLIASKMLIVSGIVMCIEVLAMSGIGAMVSIVAIVVIVHVAPEVRSAMEPWTRAYEDSAREPLGAIVAIRGTFVRRVVEVTVGTDWRRPNLHCNLSVQLLRCNSEGQHSKCNGHKISVKLHIFNFPPGAASAIPRPSEQFY